MFSRIVNRLVKPFIGKKKYQKRFEFLHQLALRGMNIGGGTDASTSGETVILEEIKNKLSDSEQIVIFDVGANKGQYCNLLQNIFGKKAVIHSFEPSKNTFKLLEQNTASFKNVSRHNIGLGEKNETVALYSNEEGSELASVFNRQLDHFNIQMNKIEEIHLESLDSFCSKNKITSIDLLKLDVEGNELNALKGASKTIEEGKIKFIQFEFGGCNIDSRTYFRDFYFLLSDKYDIFRIVSNGYHEIKEYNEKLEIFTTTNYLAVLKQTKS